MSFLELVFKRRSIRNYSASPIEKAKLDRILQAGLASPSSKHLNPWEFVVVQDRTMLQKLAAVKTYGSGMLTTAAAAIVVCADSSLTDTWQADASIAAYGMLLCAEAEGLGGCWVQVAGREQSEVMVKQMLSIPDNLNVLCILSLGYKAEEKKTINPEKLQYQKLHYERY